MRKNRELSLEDIGQQLPELRDKLEKVLPSYVASLERVSEMPVEFGRRWRTSWVEEHLEKVRQSYQQLVNQGMMAGLFGGIVSNLMSMVTRQPSVTLNQAPSWPFAISVLPSGEARPTLKSIPQQAEVITVSFEEFEQAALRLKDNVLSGEPVPEDEAEVQRLIYDRLAKTKS